MHKHVCWHGNNVASLSLVRPVHSEEEGEGKGEGGSIQSTGHLGDVMKESTEIAYTYAKVKNVTCLLFHFDTHIPFSGYHDFHRAFWHSVETRY